MSFPRVSIHILSYNHRAYIREAIASALAQDYPNLEIVIADDASTDGTAEILRDLAHKHPNIIVPVIGAQNIGITRNSNRGLKACTGELIAFMDSDDVLLPGKIAAQAQWFAASPRRVLCGHQLEVFYEDGSRDPHPLTRALFSGIGADRLIRHIPFGKSSVMVRADRLLPKGFDERMPIVSDLLMYVDVVRSDGEFGYVDATLGRYRRHSANITNDPTALLDEVAKYLRIVREDYPEFSAAVRYAETRRLFYDPANALLELGRKADARRKLLQALRREPWFAKAWVRLAQTLV